MVHASLVLAVLVNIVPKIISEIDFIVQKLFNIVQNIVCHIVFSIVRSICEY